MSGLIAVFAPSGIGAALVGMTARFPSRAAHRDSWQDPHFAAARLHHGVITPEIQPVWSADGSTCLFLDGELFPSDDAEAPAGEAARLCLELYQADRPEAFGALNGSFALVVYDRVRRCVTMISDRHNTRPLYYFTAGSELALASHVAALTAHPACPRRLDRQALHELMAYRCVLGDHTIYRGIAMLPAATMFTFDGRDTRARGYWQLRFRQPSVGKKAAAGLLADGIRRAVRLRLAGTVRPGLLLSGGLDSRIVLAAAEPPPICFTIGIGETPQVESARRAASLKQAVCKYLQVDADAYWASFEEAVRLTSGMYGAQHNHFLPVLDTIRRQCDVLLHGWAFGSIYRDHTLPSRSIRFRGRALRLPWLAPLSGGRLAGNIGFTRKAPIGRGTLVQVLTPEAHAEHDGRLQESVTDLLRGYEPEADTSPYHAWDYAAFRSIGRAYSYPNLLSIRSRMDERTVALDHDLFEFFLQMPPDWRLPDTVFRAALAALSPALARLAYADTGLPASIDPVLERALQPALELSRLLGLGRGSGVSAVAGQGSWPNFNHLLRQQAGFRARLERLPHSEALLACGLFDRTGLKRVIGGHLHGDMNEPKLLLMLLTLDSWIGQFGADGVD